MTLTLVMDAMILKHSCATTDWRHIACVFHTNEVRILVEGYYHLDSDLQGAAEVREVATTC